MPFEIIRNDITQMSVDAIVNTANPAPAVGSGVDSAIHKAAGRELLEARKAIGPIAVGDAVLTPGYRLSCKYVIHTVGPVWVDGAQNEEKKLSSCYRKALQLAVQSGCESVAFPLISTGNYGFPPALALQVAIREFSAFLMENELQIYLVVFGQEAFALSEKLVRSVESYIDENYIREKTEEEYRQAFLAGGARGRLERKECRSAKDGLRHSRRELEKENACQLLSAEMPELCEAAECAEFDPDRLDDRLQKLDAGFSEMLLQLIDRSGKTDPQIYSKANVDRKLFSKIRNNPAYRPSKTTALAFAFALELDLQQTEDLIARAGYALTHASKFDVIVEYFLIHRNYNIFELNEVLFRFDQPLLGA